MFENLRKGWRLGSEVRRLVMSDRKLFIYPILSGLISILLAVAIFGSLFLFGFQNSVTTVVLLFIYYVAVVFIGTYMLVAMLIAFRAYVKGKPISMGEAFSQAGGYSTQILEWALFYAIIIMLIRLLESRMKGIGGAILSAVASVALSIAILFVVPTIIDQKLGPVKAVEASVKFVKDNFGAAFGGLAFSDLYSMIFTVSGILLFIVGAVAFAVSAIAAASLIVIGIVLLVFGGLVNYMLSNVFKLILYDYKLTGKLPKGIDADLVNSSILNKKQKAANNVL